MQEYRVFEGKNFVMVIRPALVLQARPKAQQMLLTKQRVDYIKIDTPKGVTLKLEVEDVSTR